MGKYFVVAFCILLVILAVVIIFKSVKNQLKGNGCSGCSSCDKCSLKGKCSKEIK